MRQHAYPPDNSSPATWWNEADAATRRARRERERRARRRHDGLKASALGVMLAVAAWLVFFHNLL